ncbi:hypothetical protein HY993_01630 [Candidatus Micrarchaeota archaeon]|nr:hypothetical protein [Candidatus Micrarchaeota archaeon]
MYAYVKRALKDRKVVAAVRKGNFAPLSAALEKTFSKNPVKARFDEETLDKNLLHLSGKFGVEVRDEKKQPFEDHEKIKAFMKPVMIAHAASKIPPSLKKQFYRLVEVREKHEDNALADEVMKMPSVDRLKMSRVLTPYYKGLQELSERIYSGQAASKAQMGKKPLTVHPVIMNESMQIGFTPIMDVDYLLRKENWKK